MILILNSGILNHYYRHHQLVTCIVQHVHYSVWIIISIQCDVCKPSFIIYISNYDW